jgi:hypothetical protein
MNNVFWRRALSSIKKVLPGTLKTCIWVIEITVGVSFLILLLRFFNILPFISSALSPLFHLIGLPGEAALAYVSGYFVNVYSAIAVAVTLNLDVRALTILGVMVLCSHNMIVETAVQKKTGTPAWRIVIIRTFSAIFLAFILNLIMPGESLMKSSNSTFVENPHFGIMFKEWLWDTLILVVKLTVIIFSLNILQRILADFGVIKWISKFLRPLLKFFGLPARSSFLWIIANTVGLAYGAAAMIDEVNEGKLSQKDVNLTNFHICISHSNLEDLILLSSIGCIWWILLLSRWLMSTLIVWEYRMELIIKNKFVHLHFKLPENGSRKS